MIGEILNDRYKITSDIGDGGMATVYRAVDLSLQREVAIKILHPHLAKDRDLAQRFHQEAAIAARLDHPNVMKIYDYGTHSDKRSYIVAELIRGRDFHKLQVENARVSGDPFPAVACAMVVEEALGGLAAAHAMNVVHRDVKPDNVMIAEDGAVKLMDFGIAKNTSTSLTMTGHFLGSPSYASPEQVKGEGVDARSDLYSMGIILYEALTNRLPFTGQSAPEVMMKICTGKYTPLRQVRPSLPRELADLVTRALHVDRGARFASAAEMLKDLRAFLMMCGVQSSRTGLQRYFVEPEAFLAEHPLPAAKAKQEPRRISEEKETKVSPRDREKDREKERDKEREREAERREEREITPTRRAVGGNAPAKEQPEYKTPRELASALRERAALAGTQVLRDRGAGGQGAGNGSGGGGSAGETRDFRQTQAQREAPAREAPAREVPFRERRAQTVRDVSFRDTERRSRSSNEGGFPAGLLVLAIAAIGLFAVFMLASRGDRGAARTGGEGRSAAREDEARRPQAPVRTAEPRQEPRAKPRPPRRANKETNEPEAEAPRAEAQRTEASRAQEPPRAAEPPRPEPRPTRPAARPTRAPRPESRPVRVAVAPPRADAPEAPRPAAAPPSPEPAKETKPQVGRVSLQTVPGGVPVYLGNDLLGETSRDGTARAFDAKPGPAILRVPRQQIAGTRYEGATRKIFVEAGGTTSLGVIALTAVRTLTVNITGPGVIVRINGDPYVIRGKPVALNLPEGRVDIEARASNGKTLRRSVDLRGDDFALNASLE